jgi:hypothetical protein
MGRTLLICHQQHSWQLTLTFEEHTHKLQRAWHGTFVLNYAEGQRRI